MDLFKHNGVKAFMVQCIAMILLLDAVLTFAGYALGVDLLTTWNTATAMSLSSAFCFASISIALWVIGAEMAHYRGKDGPLYKGKSHEPRH